jgi:CheY-like chemotaxis protein
MTPVAREVLLVEDNPADVRLTEEALKDVIACNRLTIASDGLEAYAMLLDRLTRNVPLPHIVLLDLNLPRMDGREVLELLKGHEVLRPIPVIVMTTSHAAQDIARSYALGANAFINKSADLDEFFATMAAFAQFWLRAARLSA